MNRAFSWRGALVPLVSLAVSACGAAPRGADAPRGDDVTPPMPGRCPAPDELRLPSDPEARLAQLRAADRGDCRQSGPTRYVRGRLRESLGDRAIAMRHYAAAMSVPAARSALARLCVATSSWNVWLEIADGRVFDGESERFATAMARAATGYAREVRAELARRLDNGGADPSVVATLAAVELVTGRVGDAAAYAQLAARSGSDLAQQVLALALGRLGDPEADEVFREARARRPESPLVLAHAHYLVRAGRLREALEALAPWIAAHPLDEEAAELHATAEAMQRLLLRDEADR